MLKEQEIDPSLPSLTLAYGHGGRRCRVLDKDIMILGRAQSCDLALVSPEVAPVHCVLSRGPGGWRVRDCSGRVGTRVNGKNVQDEPLRDGDALQIGTFTFEVRLPSSGSWSSTPAPWANRGPTPLSALPQEIFAELARIERLQRSRRNFAQMALALRRRLREGHGEEDWLEERQGELDRQAENLQAMQQELDRRIQQAQKARQDADAARVQLEHDRASFAEELARRERSVEQRERTMEQRDKAAEQREHASEQRDKSTEQRERPVEQRERCVELRERALARIREDLNRRAAELGHFSSHLRRLRARCQQASEPRPST